MTTTVSITAIHTETKAVIVLQGVTNLTDSGTVWNVTIADMTISLDRTAWTVLTNSIAAPITG